MSGPLILDSLQRRMRAMHSLYDQAVSSMSIEHVNHFERDGVLPIAFSLFSRHQHRGRLVHADRRRPADLG